MDDDCKLLVAHANEIARILRENDSPARQSRELFEGYTACEHGNQDAFVLSLITVLVQRQAMRKPAAAGVKPETRQVFIDARGVK